MKNSIFLLLFFCLSTSILNGQIQLDSLKEFLNRKQYAKVVAMADSLSVATDSTNYDLILTIGQAYEGLLRYRQANEYYSRCYELDTTNVEVLDLLANTSLNLGRMVEAEDFYCKMVAIDTTSFYTNNKLAKFYYNAGRYEKAIPIYTYLSDMERDNPALLTALGNCYIKQDKYSQAVSNYKLAYGYNRENIVLAVSLINAMLYAGGDFTPEALIICDTALHYNPDALQLLRVKGMALYANERYKEADTLYTNLMAFGDSTYNTIKYCGLARYNVDQFVNAIEPLETAFLMDTTSVDVCLYLGSSLGQTYDRKRAFLLFDKAEKMMETPAAQDFLLRSFRADTYRKDRQENIASRIYYELWKEYPGRMDFLSQIYQMNNRHLLDYSKKEEQQESLFIHVLFTKTLLELQRENRDNFLYSVRVKFQTLYDDMFFNEVKSMQMLAPDGKKSSITMEELYSLIERLPNE